MTDADLIAAAAALRWVRPDLTAALADHVLDEASAAGERDRWLAAAGWAVHARSATGDGRGAAADVLGALSQWSGDVLARPAARRLRIELATVAAGLGEVGRARGLLAPVVADDDPELFADLLCARARCAVEDGSADVADALSAAMGAWEAVDGPAGMVGGASVSLISAVVQRRAGRAEAAVDHALDGLGRLERGRGADRSGTPSAHLAAALAAEWIAALLDAGRPAEAREACAALVPRLSERARPTRQLALLRLTVARAVAADDAAADTAHLLAQAADDAAGGDVPELEAVCRTALGALQEKAGRLEAALETLQLAVAAERRDRSRTRRVVAALAELPHDAERPRSGSEVGRDVDDDATATAVLPVVGAAAERESAREAASGGTGRRARRARSEPEAGPSTVSEDVGSARSDVGSDAAPEWESVRWTGSAGDSPIGDLLIRGLRGSGERPEDAGAVHRNGGGTVDEDGSAARGWMPSVDPARSDRRSRHGRGSRRRSRADEERAGRPDAPSSVDAAAATTERAGNRQVGHAEAGDVLNGASSGGGHRNGAEDPWATGRWSMDPSAPGEQETARVADATRGEAITSSDTDGWLRAALAELDSALARTAHPGGGREQGSDGCTVVVDVVRDGRRFAGPRADALVRAVADELDVDLLQGPRVELGDSGTLSISGPGWSRTEATDWMHRTLPGLLAGLVAPDGLPPAAQLRAAVHDADGSVGTQILQSLPSSVARRGRADSRQIGGGRTSSARRPEWPDVAGGTSGPDGPGIGSGHVLDDAEADPRGWPWSGAEEDVESDGRPLGGGSSDRDAHDPGVPSAREVASDPGLARAGDRSGRHGAPGRRDEVRGTGDDRRRHTSTRESGASDERAAGTGTGRRDAPIDRGRHGMPTGTFPAVGSLSDEIRNAARRGDTGNGSVADPLRGSPTDSARDDERRRNGRDDRRRSERAGGDRGRRGDDRSERGAPDDDLLGGDRHGPGRAGSGRGRTPADDNLLGSDRRGGDRVGSGRGGDAAGEEPLGRRRLRDRPSEDRAGGDRGRTERTRESRDDATHAGAPRRDDRGRRDDPDDLLGDDRFGHDPFGDPFRGESFGGDPFGDDPLGDDPLDHQPHGRDPLRDDRLSGDRPDRRFGDDRFGENRFDGDPLGSGPRGGDRFGDDPARDARFATGPYRDEFLGDGPEWAGGDPQRRAADRPARELRDERAGGEADEAERLRARRSNGERHDDGSGRRNARTGAPSEEGARRGGSGDEPGTRAARRGRNGTSRDAAAEPPASGRAARRGEGDRDTPRGGATDAGTRVSGSGRRSPADSSASGDSAPSGSTSSGSAPGGGASADRGSAAKGSGNGAAGGGTTRRPTADRTAAESAPGVSASGGSAGERKPAETDEEESGARNAREQAAPESTEGLGIADLLAGALAAYRGI